MTATRQPTPDIPRHEGDPLVTLDDVRDRYNVVAAMPDIGSARRLIRDLEDAQIDPSQVSLLGAWPQQDTPPPAALTGSDVAKSAGWGAVVGMAAISVLARKWRRRITLLGGALAGVAGAVIAVVTTPGSSRAWRQTLVADGAGTVAVGVHSSSPLEVVSGEETMHRHRPLAVNRF